MKMKLSRSLKASLTGKFGKYDFEVGVLDDAPYKMPMRGKRGLKGQDVKTRYAGIEVRKKSREVSQQMISDVSKANRDRLNRNFYKEPFQKKDSDIIKFTNEFFKLVFGRSEKRRCENLLQAVVRNPIMRGEYGPNSPLTKAVKGFDHGMIDTAQLFKAIKAKCNVR
jgi:hypothetical protein